MQTLALELDAEGRHAQGVFALQSESLEHWSYEQTLAMQPGGPQLGRHRPFVPAVQAVSASQSPGRRPSVSPAPRCIGHGVPDARWLRGTLAAPSLVPAAIPGHPASGFGTPGDPSIPSDNAPSSAKLAPSGGGGSKVDAPAPSETLASYAPDSPLASGPAGPASVARPPHPRSDPSAPAMGSTSTATVVRPIPTVLTA
jgi:hypothetical protein